MNESNQSPQKEKENLFVNLIFNLVLPILILRKGDDWFGGIIGDWAGVPTDSTLVSSILLAIAVLFPIAYGAYDFVRRKKWNFLSILGAISALFTGGIGLNSWRYSRNVCDKRGYASCSSRSLNHPHAEYKKTIS